MKYLRGYEAKRQYQPAFLWNVNEPTYFQGNHIDILDEFTIDDVIAELPSKPGESPNY